MFSTVLLRLRIPFAVTPITGVRTHKLNSRRRHISHSEGIYRIPQEYIAPQAYRARRATSLPRFRAWRRRKGCPHALPPPPCLLTGCRLQVFHVSRHPPRETGTTGFRIPFPEVPGWRRRRGIRSIPPPPPPPQPGHLLTRNPVDRTAARVQSPCRRQSAGRKSNTPFRMAVAAVAATTAAATAIFCTVIKSQTAGDTCASAVIGFTATPFRYGRDHTSSAAASFGFHVGTHSGMFFPPSHLSGFLWPGRKRFGVLRQHPDSGRQVIPSRTVPRVSTPMKTRRRQARACGIPPASAI